MNLVADANELTDAALYPAGSPLWDADGRVEEIEGPSFSDGAGPSYDDDSAGGAGVDSGGGLSGDSGGGGVLAALWGSGAARTVVNGIGGSNTGSRRAGATGAADLAAASAGGGVAGLDLTAFPGASALDPFDTVREELSSLNASVRALLGVDHPVLETVARYFFNWEGGKKVRPALVLLMAHAVNAHVAAAAGEAYMPSGRLFLSREALAQGAAAAAAGASAHDDEGGGVGSGGSFVGGSASLPAAARPSLPAQFALPLQRRLAEVAELIHTASLLHDDVIDGADTRRGASSVNAAFGNKLAVLAGDFLLARASVALARLRNVPTVELLSTVIEHLVKGEVMQMRPPPSRGGASRAAFDAYLRKSYYKTGSLMANSCRAVGLLGSYPDAVCDAAFRYGLHVGVAFQLVDDALGEWA